MLAERLAAPARRGGALLRRGRALLRQDSVLLIDVPDVAPLLQKVSGARRRPLPVNGLTPHITLLYPFLAPPRIGDTIEDELSRTLGGFEPFSFSLTGLGRFPDVLYLTPEPEEPFVRLTHALCRTAPGLEPYGGAFGRVIPHLTVGTAASPPAFAAALEAALPVHAVAGEVALMTRDRAGRWSRRRTFRLGT